MEAEAQTIDFAAEINRLRREKNAVILAHYYQVPEIQEIADKVGDSLELSRYAANTDADIIVFAGVYFMGETAKILSPDKKVLIPDMEAGCSLADSCEGSALKKFREEHPDHTIITYINSTAEVKAYSDIVCTSSNAENIVRKQPADKPIAFIPDRNLGAFLVKETGREMKLWDGACMVHEAFSIDKLLALHQKHPDAKIIAHPESEPHLLKVAHFVGSTTKLIKYVQEDPADEFIVATEGGILHEIEKQVPHKKIIMAPSYEENTCACSECGYMKLNTMQKLYLCLKNERPEVHVDAAIREKALPAMERMFEYS
ncbi:MAG: quinolinate synthase NadA [Cyclobacteriaceae bacterium]